MARAKKVWSRISHILSREGSTHRVSGLFFKAVIQAVLLFRADTWVVTPRMGKALGFFQTKLMRRLTGQIPRRKTDRKWRYTSAAARERRRGYFKWRNTAYDGRTWSHSKLLRDHC